MHANSQFSRAHVSPLEVSESKVEANASARLVLTHSLTISEDLLYHLGL